MTQLGLRYAVIGGMAVIVRGYHRATHDIDAVVVNADEVFEQLVTTLLTAGFSFRIESGREFASQHRVLLLQSPSGESVDLALGALPFEHDVVRRATQEEIATDLAVPVATTEDLIIMKLIAGRPGDFEDARRLYEVAEDLDRGRIRETVEAFANLLERDDIVEEVSRLLGGSSTGQS